ncbi:MAG: hypothetical protein NTX16_10790 [Actinobacteria bacterium]|nr:hypothetical protein [Actinomycetota bacterium]
MSHPAIEVGDKLHIITRRRFDSDVRRHFAGEVVGISGDLHSVQGYAYVFSQATNTYERRPELRTRLLSLGQEGFIVNKIPREVAMASLEYREVRNHLTVTDGGTLSLDINEFGPTR